MRKKELLKLYEAAYEKISRMTVEAEEIRAENLKLRQEIVKYEKEKTCINREDETPKNDFEKTDEFKEENIVVSSDTQLGARAIGRIVVNAARYCNSITGKGENGNIKELVNLILGRTEVAKAEILKIVTSDCEFHIKEEMINREVADAGDYFESVIAQIV